VFEQRYSTTLFDTLDIYKTRSWSLAQG